MLVNAPGVVKTIRGRDLNPANGTADTGVLVVSGSAEARGRLAGALAEPAGALLVFRAADKTAAENSAKADPYVNEGLVKSWTVRP